MCDGTMIQFCTCDGEAEAVDWVLWRVDPAREAMQLRGRVAAPPTRTPERVHAIATLLERLQADDLFDVPYTPQETMHST